MIIDVQLIENLIKNHKQLTLLTHKMPFDYFQVINQNAPMGSKLQAPLLPIIAAYLAQDAQNQLNLLKLYLLLDYNIVKHRIFRSKQGLSRIQERVASALFPSDRSPVVYTTFEEALEDTSSAFGGQHNELLHEIIRDKEEKNSCHLVEVMLKMAQTKVTYVNSVKQTPLHWAATIGKTDVVKLLIAKGAIVNAKDNEEQTALHRAADGGHTDTVDLLLKHGADINASDDLGFTPLHYAAKGGFLNTATVLIEKGADINAKDNRNETPIHKAVFHRRTEIVKLLMTNQADISIQNIYHQTPRDIAWGAANRDVLNIFNTSTTAPLSLSSGQAASSSAIIASSLTL